jgi:hypothetical protein
VDCLPCNGDGCEYNADARRRSRRKYQAKRHGCVGRKSDTLPGFSLNATVPSAFVWSSEADAAGRGAPGFEVERATDEGYWLPRESDRYLLLRCLCGGRGPPPGLILLGGPDGLGASRADGSDDLSDSGAASGARQ